MADRVLLGVGELGHRPVRRGRRRGGTPGHSRTRPIRAPSAASRPWQSPKNTRSLPARRDRRRPARTRSAAPLPAGASRISLARFSSSVASSPGVARRAHPGPAAERLGLDPGVVGDRRPARWPPPRPAPWAARWPRTCPRPRAAARPRRAAARRRSRPGPAGARTPAACAGCGSRAPATRAAVIGSARGRGADRLVLERAQVLDPAARPAPAGRRGGRARAACARPWPGPRPARRRRS